MSGIVQRKYFMASILFALFLINVRPGYCTSILVFGDDANSGFTTFANKPAMDTEALDAIFTFDVVESVLNFSLENLSEYRIHKIFFNVADHITGLAFNHSGKDHCPHSAANSELGKLKFGKNKADGFGQFDVRIKLNGGKKKSLGPGETYTATMDIFGTSPFFDTNFVSDFSVGAQDSPALAAIKFKKGPECVKSGYAGVGPSAVPEPSSILLVASGVLSLLGLRRGRKG